APQVADSTSDKPADPAPPGALAAAPAPEPSPGMAVPSEGRGNPSAERTSNPGVPGENRPSAVPCRVPTGEKRTEPGAPHGANRADLGRDDESPPVTESLRALAAELGVDEAEIAAMWYGRPEPPGPRRF